jgi:FMNH2-dependent dimethyl sulfone monooxygenase
MPQATFDEKYLTEYRRKHVPLYNSNKLKLGVFSMNCSGGMAITKAPMSLRIEWDYQLALAQLADSLGLEAIVEAIVAVSRWRGVGGEIDFLGKSFETNTFAAALAST